MALLFVSKFKTNDSYYRCDNKNCGLIKPGRPELINGEEVTQPPTGWVFPKRSREVTHPQGVTPECFCSFKCLAEHDGFAMPEGEIDKPIARVETAKEMPPTPMVARR